MTVTTFISEFLNQFFIQGLFGIFKGIGLGIANMFNIVKYINIFKANAGNFKAVDWIVAILTVIATIAILAVIVILVVVLVKKYVRVRKTLVDQEELLNEVGNLNREIIKLSTEKERILAMKVSQLGLTPGESPFEEHAEEEKAVVRLKKEVSSLAILAAERIMQRELDEKSQQALVDQVLEEAAREKWQNQ